MNYSKLFKNAILNLYKKGIYTVDYAILKATEYADKNKINAIDYEELIVYLAIEQEKEMQQEEIVKIETEEEIIEETENETEEQTENIAQEAINSNENGV